MDGVLNATPGQARHPPSLSISNKRRRRNYEDSPSNGERTGIGPALESGCHAAARIVVWRSVLSDGPGPSPWKGAPGRVRAPFGPNPVATRGVVGESGCLGMQP
ncbi:hypothetical protein IEQ34_026208 [Dendrobium chrysotoxum]|uniref:Uncharacterized protein n=1 Tax=Dendrobium chrysotoxum TaxID=161865 RepID=A0AAV7FM66_DENCH|nr:hypothetical protein IEQ34_026208 [Dendrobium chrysotoxum]